MLLLAASAVECLQDILTVVNFKAARCGASPTGFRGSLTPGRGTAVYRQQWHFLGGFGGLRISLIFALRVVR